MNSSIMHRSGFFNGYISPHKAPRRHRSPFARTGSFSNAIGDTTTFEKAKSAPVPVFGHGLSVSSNMISHAPTFGSPVPAPRSTSCTPKVAFGSATKTASGMFVAQGYPFGAAAAAATVQPSNSSFFTKGPNFRQEPFEFAIGVASPTCKSKLSSDKRFLFGGGGTKPAPTAYSNPFNNRSNCGDQDAENLEEGELKESSNQAPRFSSERGYTVKTAPDATQASSVHNTRAVALDSAPTPQFKTLGLLETMHSKPGRRHYIAPRRQLMEMDEQMKTLLETMAIMQESNDNRHREFEDRLAVVEKKQAKRTHRMKLRSRTKSNIEPTENEQPEDASCKNSKKGKRPVVRRMMARRNKK